VEGVVALRAAADEGVQLGADVCNCRLSARALAVDALVDLVEVLADAAGVKGRGVGG